MRLITNINFSYLYDRYRYLIYKNKNFRQFLGFFEAHLSVISTEKTEPRRLAYRYICGLSTLLLYNLSISGFFKNKSLTHKNSIFILLNCFTNRASTKKAGLCIRIRIHFPSWIWIRIKKAAGSGFRIEKNSWLRIRKK